MLLLVAAPARSAAPPEPVPTFAVPASPRWAPAISIVTIQLTALRFTEAYLYPEPFAATDSSVLRHYRDAFTQPPLFDGDKPAFRWDGDPLVINVIGHGLLGSELHLRARTCGFGWAGSWLFAAAASTAWEYVFEGNGVRPSLQDLLYTPMAGLALGEGRFALLRLAGTVRAPVLRAVLRAVFDPFGELARSPVGGSPC